MLCAQKSDLSFYLKNMKLKYAPFIVRHFTIHFNGDPVIVQIISSTKNFKIMAIGDKLFYVLIDFLRLLTLAASNAVDDITRNPTNHVLWVFSFAADQTCLLRMLQVEAM